MLRSTIASLADKSKGEKKFRFKQLQELEVEIPWGELTEIIAPHYLEATIGRLLVPTETMLRVYFLQLRYGMSAAGVEEALFEVQVLRDFALVDLDTDVIPNESCILSFQLLLRKHELEEKFEEAFNLEPIVVEEERSIEA